MQSHQFPSISDAGCRTREMLKLRRMYYPGTLLSGIDISSQMLKAARNRIDNKAFLLQADADHLSCDDAAFDLIVRCDTFHHPAHLNVLTEF